MQRTVPTAATKHVARLMELRVRLFFPLIGTLRCDSMTESDMPSSANSRSTGRSPIGRGTNPSDKRGKLGLNPRIRVRTSLSSFQLINESRYEGRFYGRRETPRSDVFQCLFGEDPVA